ncbi:hypothetical protein BD413DRAFT_593087 [Trametes elegans]|nr:hypothetical protein BD413DRAFT_593087 [Trametes elegans]
MNARADGGAAWFKRPSSRDGLITSSPQEVPPKSRYYPTQAKAVARATSVDISNFWMLVPLVAWI